VSGQDVRRLLLDTNLGPAVVAAGVLLGLVFVLDVPLWLAAPLAFAAYFGVVLLTPRRPDPKRLERARQEELAQILDDSARLVGDMRRSGRVLRDAGAAERVAGIADTAEAILGVLGEEGRDPEPARNFAARYLAPSTTLLERYGRLARRRIASAEPALAKIETEDLPLIERKFRELYEQLHRGDLIDLEVASEMLEFQLDGIDVPSPRSVGP
jgi:hypothetical protein